MDEFLYLCTVLYVLHSVSKCHMVSIDAVETPCIGASKYELNTVNTDVVVKA